jgi:hypothetical protein
MVEHTIIPLASVAFCLAIGVAIKLVLLAAVGAVLDATGAIKNP